MNKVEVVSFRKKIPKGSNGDNKIILKEKIKDAGTVEGIKGMFYEGQGKNLTVYPYVIHKGNRKEDLITYVEGTDPFLSGNKRFVDVPANCQVDKDDYIYMEIENLTPDDETGADYSLDFDIIVDYYAGKRRAIGGVI